MPAGSDLLGDLELHECLGEHANSLAQEIDIPATYRLAKEVGQFHAVVGHRVCPFSECLVASKNHTVAAYCSSRRPSNTTWWDAT